jgi:aminomethyltransferase
MGELRKTVLHERHLSLGAMMVDFGGWHMPLQYPRGIVEEHLAVRREAGLFDISHMGRFAVHGPGALPFLQHVLSNDAAALTPGWAQYTMIPDDHGGAIDDAYLYRFAADTYLLVVNAANRDTDRRYLLSMRAQFPSVEIEDLSAEMAMLALQGPRSEEILMGVLGTGALPERRKNALAEATVVGRRVWLARTGYTGEPLGCECFVPAAAAPALWDILIERGAVPVGLGARDTLRLEAGLPLYGHELGRDPEGAAIPLFACRLARFAVSFAPRKGAFVGKHALAAQAASLASLKAGDDSPRAHLPRAVVPFALRGRGIARAGFRVYRGDAFAGFVTSGTMVPYWRTEGSGPETRFTGRHEMRAIGLMLADARLKAGDEVDIEIRGSRVAALVVPRHLRSDSPPYAVPVFPENPSDHPNKEAS